MSNPIVRTRTLDIAVSSQYSTSITVLVLSQRKPIQDTTGNSRSTFPGGKCANTSKNSIPFAVISLLPSSNLTANSQYKITPKANIALWNRDKMSARYGNKEYVKFVLGIGRLMVGKECFRMLWDGVGAIRRSHYLGGKRDHVRGEIWVDVLWWKRINTMKEIKLCHSLATRWEQRKWT